MNNYISEQIRSIGRSLVDAFVATGMAYTGINGPYDDPETEVRNLSHLLVIASIEYSKYGMRNYYNAIVNIADRILAMKDSTGIYIMRMKGEKDRCNGVIGHAWLIEGLLYAYKVTNEEKYLKECKNIINKHDFNYDIGLWGRPLEKANDDSIDYTFNHQLWYAATLLEANQYLKDEKLTEEFKCFCLKLSNNFKVGLNGRIVHGIFNRLNKKQKYREVLKYYIFCLYEIIGRRSFKYKEEGYHMFNIMAFARIFVIDEYAPIFKCNKVRKALSYCNSSSLYEGLLSSKLQEDLSGHGKITKKEESEINIYGFPYNVPGFEIKYVAQAFKGIIEKEQEDRLLNNQMNLIFCADKDNYLLRCHDKITIQYRVYEYYRFLEIAK